MSGALRLFLRRRLALLLGLLAIAALAAAACGGDPNELEADQFVRSPAPGADRDRSTDEGAGQQDAEGQAGQGAAEDQARSQDEQPAREDRDGSDTAGSDENEEDEIDLADDIVRRYLSDHYGYSLELVCEPFCDATSTGIDRVGFLASDGRALINITVRPADAGAPEFEALEAQWRLVTSVPEFAEIVDRQRTVLVSDGVTEVLRLSWIADRRATGGFLERWLSLIAQVGPIRYYINAGAVQETFDDVEPVLVQALDTFLPRADPPGVPGRYTRWDFVFNYDTNGVTGELGNATPVPSFDSGVFLQQTAEGALQLLLIWETISAALFDPDQAITDSLTGGIEATEDGPRRNATIGDGITTRLSLASSDAQGQETRIATYAWYCEDGGRSFVLQSFHAEDPQGQVAQTLEEFQCTGDDD